MGVATVESDRFVVVVDDDVIAITSVSVERVETGLPHGRLLREAISRDGRVVAWQDVSYHVFVRDRTGALHSPDGHCGPVALSPDGDLLAFGDTDGVHLVSLPECAPVVTFPIKWTTALAFGPDGQTLACISDPRARPREDLVVFDVKTNRRILRRTGLQLGCPSSFVFSKDARKILIADCGRLLTIDLARRTKPLEDLADAEVPMDVIPIAECHAQLIAPMRDGKLFVADDESSAIRLFDSWGRELRRSPTIAGHASLLLLSASEELLLLGGAESLALHDAKTGALLRVLHLPRLYMTRLEHRGAELVATGQAVCTYDRASGRLSKIEPVATFSGSLPSPTTRSPDGELEAQYPSGEFALAVLATRSNQVLWRVKDESHGPLAFSPDSRVLAVAKNDYSFSVQLHDSRTGALLATIQTPSKKEPTLEGAGFFAFLGIMALGFSPDGRELAVGFMDGSIGVYDVAGALRK